MVMVTLPAADTFARQRVRVRIGLDVQADHQRTTSIAQRIGAHAACDEAGQVVLTILGCRVACLHLSHERVERRIAR